MRTLSPKKKTSKGQKKNARSPRSIQAAIREKRSARRYAGSLVHQGFIRARRTQAALAAHSFVASLVATALQTDAPATSMQNAKRCAFELH